MKKYKWQAGVNGTGKRPWFVFHTSRVDYSSYHRNCTGILIRFKSFEAANRRAEFLNKERPNG